MGFEQATRGCEHIGQLASLMIKILASHMKGLATAEYAVRQPNQFSNLN